MIQRLQTVWLSISAFLAAFLCSGHILNFSDNSGNDLFLSFSGIFRSSGNSVTLLQGSIPVAVLLIAICALSVTAIFLFKRRKLQLKMTAAIIILAFCLTISLVLYLITVIRIFGAELVPGYKMVLPLLIIIFTFLAYRGIKKDDDLVKSYDRLR